MENAVQLELNLESRSSHEMQLSLMQKQIDQMCDSMGKVRRKLFSEMSEMKKLFAQLEEENFNLKTTLKELKNERTEWTYGQNGCLFDVREHQEAVG